jgi:hypothetical protein
MPDSPPTRYFRLTAPTGDISSELSAISSYASRLRQLAPNDWGSVAVINNPSIVYSRPDFSSQGFALACNDGQAALREFTAVLKAGSSVTITSGAASQSQG